MSNVILQPFRGFQARGLPYWLFLDTTDAIRRAHGQEGPFGPSGLGFDTERTLYRGATHIFVMASEPRASLVHDYGVTEDAVTVVGAGVNIAYPRTLEHLGALERYMGRTVLFVGRDFERKGGPELLEAFAQARVTVPDARLVIAGIRLERDPAGVTSLGEVRDRRQVANLYETATVFCLPSRFEPTGMSIMEAMAYGLPVVGASVGGIAEAVRPETGILVESGEVGQLRDALVRLLADPDLASRMGHRARELIDLEFNWDAVVGRMLGALG
jgi:glycosyltransferase involved in cell wall biosynthesis